MENQETQLSKNLMSRPHEKITFITFISLLVIILFIFGYMVVPYLLALAAGVMLALLTYPIFLKLTKYHFYPKIAAAVVTAGIILLAVLPITMFTYLAVEQGIAIAESLRQGDNFSKYSPFHRISEWDIMKKVFSGVDGVRKQFTEWSKEIEKFTVATLLSFAASLPDLLLQLVLTLISYFYFLLDGPKFISWINNRIPLDIDVRKKIVKTFADTTISVIWATLAAAAVQSLIMLIAFIALSVPAVFLGTAATFIFAWIPIVGSTPVWVLGALYLYTQGSYLKVILMILFGIITGIADNVVRPYILKGRANMHPLVSLVAIFGGIGIFGILGVFIGPIIAAVLISLLQIWPVLGQPFGFFSSVKTK